MIDAELGKNDHCSIPAIAEERYNHLMTQLTSD
jgi:hypothetical protein